MRRKHRRRRLRAKPVLWLLVFIEVCVALYASRLTDVRHIEVFGVRPYDEPRLSAILSSLRGVPNAKIDAAKIESMVMEEPSVLYAELSTSILGKGSLRIVYRRPVARILGLRNLALDANGVIYSAPDLPADLTRMGLADGGPPTLVGLAGSWQAQRLADLALEVRTLRPKTSVEIQVDRGGAICLNVGPGRVLLGSCDDLNRKLKVLRQRLIKNPNELLGLDELVLVNPDAPALVKRKRVVKN